MRRNRVLIVAILTPHRGALHLFHQYEQKAAAIMMDYGGALEQTITEEPARPGELAREIHVVSFPDWEAFERYRADPGLLALAGMRSASIAHTELLIGRDGPEYGGRGS